MHYFATTLDECQSAIQEMWQTFTTTQPGQLEMGHGGNWTVSAHGNGRWYRDSSYYFNCGVNEEQEEGQTDPVNAVPFDQQRGTLAQNTMDELVQWFNTNYGDNRGNVLVEGPKYNFTGVVNGRAFNFHLEVA